MICGPSWCTRDAPTQPRKGEPRETLARPTGLSSWLESEEDSGPVPHLEATIYETAIRLLERTTSGLFFNP